MRISCVILLALVISMNFAAVCFSQCLDDQKALLMDIHSTLIFHASQSVKLANWDYHVDCCSWPGVVCCSKGRVIELDLSSESIHDGFDNSSSIFRLKYLQRLNLAFNDFQYITIPSGWADLSTLRYLNLSHAGFTGQVPIQFSALRELRVLDASSYYFRLEISDFTGLVENLTHLSELYLDGVNISSSGTTWSNVLSSSTPHLTGLSLSACSLLGPVDDSLAKLQYLSFIRLDGNNLSSLDPGTFAKFCHLVSLSLASCELEGTFPAEVFQLQTLQELYLSGNQFLNGNLPRFLANSPLKKLELPRTNFSGTIPESIGELKMLSTLDLRSCNFHGTIPSQLWTLESMVRLDLSSNRVNSSMQSLSSLVNLTELMLSDNLLTGPISDVSWKELVRLEILELSHNSFSGSIPADLFGMPSLRILTLSHNRFESLEIMDNNNVSFSLLKTLDLSHNSFSGSIPAYLFGLPSVWMLTLSHNRFESLEIMEINNALYTLDLSNNNFSETLDLSLLHHLRNLSSLDLSFNNLSINDTKINYELFPQLSYLSLASSNIKAFPDFLKYQASLIYLDLSDNKIHGVIPKWLWNMNSVDHLNLSYNALVDFEDRNHTASLSYLDLSSNFLQGGLPSLPPIAYFIDFSSNHFSSKLPSEIGTNLSRLSFFSLANNFMEGTIPSSICDAQSLTLLDLSDNRFDGHLPPCISNMTSRSLTYLNLRNNSITGYTSDSFTTNCNLIALDMSGNLIEGKLPKSLVNCEHLEVLDLGDNEFEDSFPCWLRNISSLRVLVLRSNRLHGRIRCPDTTREWRTLQIVDLACNKFNDSLSSDTLSSFKGMMTNSGEAESTGSDLKSGPAGHFNYSAKIIFKGQQMEFVYILTVFGSMDLSRNQFSGDIPHMIGNLTSLYTLNLSHNMFSSHIPTSLGNLKRLESLDLSQNRLTGQIPTEFAKLTFLSVLNLSYNSLEGRIPTGNQFNTFTDESYVGNKALCGFPMPECASPAPSEKSSSFSSTIDWEVLVPGFGFLFGAWLTIAPLFFSKKWARWHDQLVLKVLSLVSRPS